MNPLFPSSLFTFTLPPPQFSGLYLVSLVVILIGFITFNIVPTPTNPTDSSVSSSTTSMCEEGCQDNPVAAENDVTRKEVAIRILTEEEEDEEELSGTGVKEDKKERRKRSASQSFGEERNDELVGGHGTRL